MFARACVCIVMRVCMSMYVYLYMCVYVSENAHVYMGVANKSDPNIGLKRRLVIRTPTKWTPNLCHGLYV